jgi:hypothetical protein
MIDGSKVETGLCPDSSDTDGVKLYYSWITVPKGWGDLETNGRPMTGISLGTHRGGQAASVAHHRFCAVCKRIGPAKFAALVRKHGDDWDKAYAASKS